ncbi:hypothetical protein GCM10010458_16530 [Microbacterium luteolum]|uniref:Uncharacterized protein n=1 Tax=Microbacterium luteolum TaxID=69367 RepID=A0ABY7XQB6_MICLT|nr:hypothetical protein [Microbacterium luteolum]WDM44356.1 hypothetical protein KV395_14360 [Microbacterium luteolum]
MTEDYPSELHGLLKRIAPGWPELLEVGAGWYPLLARLDATLSVIAPNYVVQQVKSKFGALCFYADPSDDSSHFDEAFTAAVRAAEWESTETCEACGAPARQYVIRMWVSTLCQPHAATMRDGALGSDPPPLAV